MSKEIADLIAKRFIARSDIKAIQQKPGHYTPDRCDTEECHAKPCDKHKFKRQDLLDHIECKKSFGHYLVNQDNKAKLFAFDIDLVKTTLPGTTKESGKPYTWDGKRHIPGSPRDYFANGVDPAAHLTRELLIIADFLAGRVKKLDIPVAVAFSGAKGVHVYGFTGLYDAGTVRSIAHEVLKDSGVFALSRGQHFYRHTTANLYGGSHPEWGYPNIEIEVFPKQDNLTGKDLGNLMRLPLGVHRRTGQRSRFLALDMHHNEMINLSPITALKAGNPWI